MLTFAAGCVDIVGFLALYQSFTAHMTGVTVHLANNLANLHWHDAAILLGVLLAFTGGSVLGRTIIEVCVRLKLRTAATSTLLLEAALIAVVAFAARSASPILLLILLALAMGIQTASLTRVGSLTVHTTFVTGMLNKLAQLVARAAVLLFDSLRGNRRREHLRPATHRQAILIFSIWLLYLVGAMSGAWMFSRWGVQSLLVAAGVVGSCAIIDQFTPLAIEEERDQSER